MPRSRHRKKKPGRVRAGRRYVVDEELGVFSPPDESMSSVILEFLEPYRKFARDEAAFAKLAALGVVAWNVALVPEAEREKALNAFAVAAFGAGRRSMVGHMGAWVRARLGLAPSDRGHVETRDHRNFKATVGDMIERKLREFPNNHRFIVDYRISGSGEHEQLFVVSTLERPRV